MSQQPAYKAQTMDRTLFARLTGNLGDQAALAKLGATFTQVYAEFLPDIVKSETGLDVNIAYAGCQSGPMSDLIAGLGGNHALVNGSLRNWAPKFVLGCGAGFIMTLMEHMLGARPEDMEAAVARPLSVIELDLSVMMFDKIANVLRSAVNAPGGFEPYLDPPYNVEDRPKTVGDEGNDFAAAITMAISLGKSISHIVIIVPQCDLLRTVVSAPRAKNPTTASQAWSDQLSEQVRRSQVTLEARVRLQSLTLDTISKLAVGDVIPFMDTDEVRVEVSANSKDLYICEFGRSGENYTVRVKDNVNSDDELLRHLMN
ncbi:MULTISPECIES: FliM/FliN family flagellar motor switch protein [unclassified Rhizobium]|uniref:FliM/FliN family flagellar motor switch protein n=1 Tax=unclassified Rhizobium TaxID=2613769 RepID=UPI000EA9D447|nr:MULTISPECIES: FliM/FliN family flagellar motor switch protein [unclassified Rhizobium]AYG65193.1 flagellar motor switch protein FliM [Rhizobium sp. CCGE531]AYG71677.1 flagellar motor switch protein FliM [Rhizobium sp. CCGE532]